MWGELHELKEIEIALPETIDSGKANRLFRELGATLFYDVYAFEAENSEIWQSESLLSIRLLNGGFEVDAQNDFDNISVGYLLATRPSGDQQKALILIANIISVFGGVATYQTEPFDQRVIQADWDRCNSYLLKEWGEEPGSESLRIMIEENYS